MIDETALNIFTDGSSYSSPRKGGVGVLFVIVNASGEEEIVNQFDYPGYKQATNNEMELEACIISLNEALTRNIFDGFKKICINTDSRYVSDNYKRAMFVWPKSGWKNPTSGRPILHVEQWKRLLKLLKLAHNQRIRVDINWIKGHSKDRHNKAADKSAKKSANNPLNKPLSIVSVRRKKTSKKIARGSVKMHGQTESVRIVSIQYLKTHKLWKYQYEIISTSSEYFGNSDTIFSTEHLRDGHSYSVVMNNDTDNPRIISVNHELDKK